MIDKTRFANEVKACIEDNIITANEKIKKELNEMGIWIDKVELKCDVKLYFNERYYNKYW
jgi:hypothetical protein